MQPSALEGKREGDSAQRPGQPRREAEPAVALSRAGETRDDGDPAACECGEVKAVGGVAVDVVVIDHHQADEVLPPAVRARVSIEAGVTFGWERWVGEHGASIGVDRYGASAPAPRIFEELGLTADAVADAVRSLL